MELVRSLGVPTKTVRASGGGARSAVWRQILADVFGTALATVNVTEGAAYGAAMLAGVGVGVFTSVEEACTRIIREQERVEPGHEVMLYAKYYERYRALYPALKEHFAALTAISQPQ